MTTKVLPAIASVVLVGTPFLCLLLPSESGGFLVSGYWCGAMVRAFMTWNDAERGRPVLHTLLPGAPLTIASYAVAGGWLIAAGYGVGVLLVAILQRFELRQSFDSGEL